MPLDILQKTPHPELETSRIGGRISGAFWKSLLAIRLRLLLA